MQVRKMQVIKYIMFAINIIAVLYVAIFIWLTTKKICDYYIAREFLEIVKAIPSKPGNIIWISAVLLGVLLLSFVLREYVYSGRIFVGYGTLVVDFVVIIGIVYILDFNYNAILFWTFANAAAYIRWEKSRYVLIALAIISFVGTDYGLVSISIGLYSINDYISYYSAGAQQYLFGIYNLLSATNIIIFIIFCVCVIQEQRGTIEEVNSLYQQLTLANQELQHANEELKQYAIVKEKMGETRERNRLAREIHDTLGHTLTGILAGIDACIAMVDCKPSYTKSQLELVAQVTRKGIQEVRRSVNELRPDALEQASLESAILNMIEAIQAVSGVRIFFKCQAGSLNFDEDEKNTIYRVIQESVTNSIRHGKAGEIHILIKKELSNIRLYIQDDGIGCKEMKKGFGTIHMLERIEMLQGAVSFDGKDGFRTEVTIPVRWGKDDD